MGKYSVERDGIMDLCRMYAVRYSGKTVRNFTTFFKVNSCLQKELPFLSGQLNEQVLKDAAPKLFSAMISQGDISEEEITGFLLSMVRSGNMNEIIEVALKDVKSQSETYHTIIYMSYFDKVKHSTEEIMKATGYKKTRFYEKREYAIMYMGLMVWRQILGYWSNSTEEMKKLEDDAGRDGSLSEAKKEAEDERSISGN